MQATHCSARGAPWSFGNLPNDIIHLILQRFVCNDYPSFGTLKRRVGLLGICRRWRGVALPIFYRHAHVCIERGKPDPELTDWRTNIDLAIEGGYLPLVRQLVIRGGPIDVQTFFFRLVKTLRLGQVAWNRVVALDIKTSSLVHSSGNAGERQFAESFAAILAGHMPLIHTMRVSAVSRSEAFNMFLNSLGACFSERLTSHRSIMLAPPVVQGTSQLTRLEMNWHGKALEVSILPHAESLQRLVLDNLPFELEWRRVCGGDAAPPRIVFPSLKYLRISYEDDLNEPLTVHGERVEADHTVVLDLPVLAMLNAKRCPSSCAVMFNSVLPPRMEAMKLFCSKSALHAISERVLPVCQRVHVHVMNIEPHLGPIAVESLDGALAKLKAEAGVSVDMVALRKPVMASGPYWNTVSCLSIDETNLDSMVQLLAALPYLHKFRVLFMSPGGVTLDAYAAKSKEVLACMQELSSSKLKDLYIALSVYMPRRPEVVGMIREIAACIPGLQRLEVVELAN